MQDSSPNFVFGHNAGANLDTDTSVTMGDFPLKSYRMHLKYSNLFSFYTFLIISLETI